VDIFTPVVDSPSDWGAIAAANALSDVYAMGGTPLTALQFLAWPRDQLPFDLASEVIAGGMDVMARAGCTVLGGHSIDGEEPTFGFAVTGLAAEEGVVTNAGGRPGDALILTKPLGMGIITTAIKLGKAPPELERRAIDLMTTLNDLASAALMTHGANAATDITGYGLLGHLREVCEASGVGAEVDSAAVPVLEGVADLASMGVWPGGSQRNLEFLLPLIDTDLDELSIKPLVDAQTSGGLLVALPAEAVAGYIEDVPEASVIGRLTSEKSLRVT
jgi:selenide,water dikinase